MEAIPINKENEHQSTFSSEILNSLLIHSNTVTNNLLLHGDWEDHGSNFSYYIHHLSPQINSIKDKKDLEKFLSREEWPLSPEERCEMTIILEYTLFGPGSFSFTIEEDRYTEEFRVKIGSVWFPLNKETGPSKYVTPHCDKYLLQCSASVHRINLNESEVAALNQYIFYNPMNSKISSDSLLRNSARWIVSGSRMDGGNVLHSEPGEGIEVYKLKHFRRVLDEIICKGTILEK